MSEVEGLDQLQHKSINNLPDLGVKTPEDESQVEALRQSVVRIVTELDKPDNYEEFRAATIAMFEGFGIAPTTDEVLSQRNERMWKGKYSHYQEMTRHINPNADIFLDIEMVGQGAYVNIYLESNSVKTLKGRSRETKVYPGACSLPQPISGKSESSWHAPERNFYRTFEEVVGVDLSLKTDADWPHNPYTLQHLSDMYTFKVVDGKYQRKPAIKERSTLRDRIAKAASWRPGSRR